MKTDTDIEIALDLVGGPLMYQLLVTGGQADEEVAAAVVDAVLTGIKVQCIYPELGRGSVILRNRRGFSDARVLDRVDRHLVTGTSGRHADRSRRESRWGIGSVRIAPGRRTHFFGSS
ncbi:hypothetical protein BH23GEM9_BH23GEM9_12920 [soil metagenome]